MLVLLGLYTGSFMSNLTRTSVTSGDVAKIGLGLKKKWGRSKVGEGGEWGVGVA